MRRSSVVSATWVPQGMSGARLTLASVAGLALLLGGLCLGAATSRSSAMFAERAGAPPQVKKQCFEPCPASCLDRCEPAVG